jgi:hypothetical protein
VFPIRRLPRAILAVIAALIVAPALAQPAPEALHEGRSSLGPASRAAWLERVERARARYEVFAMHARLAVHPRVIEPGVPPPPHATGIFDDPTLRRGDVVVTPEGLLVFRGSSHLPRTLSDFEPITSAAPVRHAPELIELQRAHDLGKR